MRATAATLFNAAVLLWCNLLFVAVLSTGRMFSILGQLASISLRRSMEPGSVAGDLGRRTDRLRNKLRANKTNGKRTCYFSKGH
jgi:hypothetical protein